MKKFLIALCLCASAAQAQISYINLTSLATNVTTGSAVISIPGICTNYAYTVVNSNNIVTGDSIPSAFGKINSSFAYVSNELVILAQLPNQYNTNLSALLSGQTNALNTFSNQNFAALATQSNRINSCILSNAVNAAWSLTDSNNIFNFFATNVFIPVTGTSPATSIPIFDSTGAAWYIHVSTLGILSATGSP